MPPHDDSIRLRHMLDAARKAIEFSAGKSKDQLVADEKLMFAIVRLLEVVGEAARGVSIEFRKAHSEIPWKDMIGTRDRLIHGYFDVDLNIVWQIVTKDLVLLVERLEKIISD